MPSNDPRDLLDCYSSRIQHFFATANVEIDYSIELLCHNEVTGKYCHVTSTETVLIESPESIIQSCQNLPNVKCFISDEFWYEFWELYRIRIIVVFHNYSPYTLKIDANLLELTFTYFLAGLKDDTSIEAAIQQGGRDVISQISRLLHMPTLISDMLDNISALRYETAEIESALIITHSDTLSTLPLDVTFGRPIPSSEYRTVRKLLEIAKDGLLLIGTGAAFHGFISQKSLDAALSTQAAGSDIPLYKASLRGILDWSIHTQFSNSEYIPILASKFKVLSFPQQRISKASFFEKVNSKFIDHDSEELWNLVQMASSQAHGTMIVISNNAEQESHRLSKCAIAINKTKLTKDDLAQKITSIDGAIMCDPFGFCYAIGVILDGNHSDNSGETIARGARHNSAHRYSYSATFPCLVVIVSEDGDITII